MPNNQLLRNAFPKWFEGKGIFASMTSAPWQEEIDGITLDIEYFGNRSGYKFCAPLVYNFLDEDGAVTENGRQAIARVLLARYSKPWTRLWNLMKSQYDPLDNFSITEEIDMTSHASGQDKSNGTDTDKGTVETDHSGTDTNKSTGTEKTSRTGQNTSKDTSTASGSGSASRSGYNSTSPVTVNGQSAANSSTVNHVEIPNEDNTRTPDLTDERTLALKDKDTRDITIERNNLVERDNTQTDKGTRKRTGVSGLISRQRLVEQEREAWQWDFFETVFSDVDKILALSVYDPCVMSQFDYTGGGTSGGYVLPIATQAALGGVRAPAKTDGSVQVQVDAAGFLYVPPYPESSKIDFASTDKLGGIKLPSEPSGDGEEISTKNGVQFVVDKTLSPEGGYKNDDTVSVVLPYAGVNGGLVKGPAKTSETQQVAVSSDGTLWVPTGNESIETIDLGSEPFIKGSAKAKFAFSDEVLEKLQTWSRGASLVLKYSTKTGYDILDTTRYIYLAPQYLTHVVGDFRLNVGRAIIGVAGNSTSNYAQFGIWVSTEKSSAIKYYLLVSPQPSWGGIVEVLTDYDPSTPFDVTMFHSGIVTSSVCLPMAGVIGTDDAIAYSLHNI